MTTRHEEQAGYLEIAYRAVQATLATLAVYRGARGALNAWKGVYKMIRGPQAETKPPAPSPATKQEPT